MDVQLCKYVCERGFKPKINDISVLFLYEQEVLQLLNMHLQLHLQLLFLELVKFMEQEEFKLQIKEHKDFTLAPLQPPTTNKFGFKYIGLVQVVQCLAAVRIVYGARVRCIAAIYCGAIKSSRKFWGSKGKPRLQHSFQQSQETKQLSAKLPSAKLPSAKR